jgi:hypothetical protein
MNARHDDYFCADVTLLLRQLGAWRLAELLLDAATEGGFRGALEEAVARAAREDQTRPRATLSLVTRRGK